MTTSAATLAGLTTGTWNVDRAHSTVGFTARHLMISKVRGSFRDRHERIGDGHIGEDAFADLLAHPATAGVPFILETPGSGDVTGTCLPLLKKLRER